MRPLAQPELEALSLVARGRAAWRRGEVAEALLRLGAGIEACDRAQRTEAGIIGRLLLGCALVQVDRADEAATCFDQVLKTTEELGDGLHCCAALGNRAFLWTHRGDVESCIADLTRAVSVAHRLGHPGTERTALLNLAEVLFWAGREDEALTWLLQARLLEDRFLPKPPHSAVLLLARIRLLRRDYAAASDALTWLAERHLPDKSAANAVAFQSALLHVLRARGTPVPLVDQVLTWERIAELSRSFLSQERAELEYWRLRADCDRGALAEGSELDVRPSALEDRVWRARAQAVFDSTRLTAREQAIRAAKPERARADHGATLAGPKAGAANITTCSWIEDYVD